GIRSPGRAVSGHHRCAAQRRAVAGEPAEADGTRPHAADCLEGDHHDRSRRRPHSRGEVEAVTTTKTPVWVEEQSAAARPERRGERRLGRTSGASLRLCLRATFVALLALGLAGCSTSQTKRVQGYVEGEFVYVAAPQAGALEYLYVQRGGQVNAGDMLFALDSAPERAARAEAEQRLAQARATLADAKKGKRPSEMESLEAQLKQAKAALALAEKELVRQQKLLSTSATAQGDFDKALSTRDQARQRVIQLDADLQTARLGLRSDQIAAAAADVRAREAALAKAEWDLAQKRQN